jgi:hypothetical protein
MQPPRPTECHCPRRAAIEARTFSVLRRLIRAVKGVSKPGVNCAVLTRENANGSFENASATCCTEGSRTGETR